MTSRKQKITDLLAKYNLNVGNILIFIGLVISYIAFYGKNLFYTQTYNYLSKFLPPIFDGEILIITIAFIFHLMLTAILPGIKIQGINTLQRNKNVKLAIFAIGSVMVSSFIVLYIMGKVLGYYWAENLLVNLLPTLALFSVGSLGLLAITIAIYPDSSKQHIRQISPKMRLVLLIGAVFLVFPLIFGLESVMTRPIPIQIIQPQQLTSSSTPSHSISAIFDEYPGKIQPGDSIPINLLFRLKPYNPNDLTGRYPINIDSSHEYGISIKVQQIGFDISDLFSDTLEIQPIEVDELITRTWIISPKSGKEGTSQSISFNIFLHDLTTNQILFQSPATTLKVEVGTPLGLPTWLISPQIGLGAILGGLTTIVLPWLLEQIAATRRQSQEKGGDKQ